jgi:pimeloyl-ACP methyl ester carboxylesterase
VRILGAIVGVIAPAHVVGFFINWALLPRESARVHPYGQLIDVDGRKMHVHALGDGDETIVLLAGAGVPLPSADFGPLMRLLAQRFTVVCIEYLGVGHSDTTPVPRTNENITRELRAALAQAGFSPPYLLMPHSASGITSEYYATQHPEEVSSIVMLDTTSSAEEPARVPPFVYRLAKVPQVTGANRILNRFVVPRLLRKKRGYTDREIRDYRTFMNRGFNDTVIDQNIRFPDNVHHVMQLEFPDTIPVLKLVPNGTLKRMGGDYQRDHMRRLGPNATHQVVEGSHFAYHTSAERILEATVRLLDRRERT